MSGNDNVSETVTAVTTTYAVTANDFAVFFDPTGGYVITLPDATKNSGREYRLVQTVSNAGQVTVKSAGGKVNTAAAGTGITLTASKLGVLTAVSNGTDWFVGGGSAVLS